MDVSGGVTGAVAPGLGQVQLCTLCARWAAGGREGGQGAYLCRLSMHSPVLMPAWCLLSVVQAVFLFCAVGNIESCAPGLGQPPGGGGGGGAGRRAPPPPPGPGAPPPPPPCTAGVPLSLAPPPRVEPAPLSSSASHNNSSCPSPIGLAVRLAGKGWLRAAAFLASLWCAALALRTNSLAGGEVRGALGALCFALSAEWLRIEACFMPFGLCFLLVGWGGVRSWASLQPSRCILRQAVIWSPPLLRFLPRACALCSLSTPT
jgi:hypothetical protein